MRIIDVFVQVVVHLELIPICKIIRIISISEKWKSSSLTVFLINTSYFDLLNLSLRLVISSLDSLLSTVIFELLLIPEFYHWSHQQLNEDPLTWLLNRLHTIVEQRQQNPTSRVDLLQLMLQVTTKETIDVNKILRIHLLSQY
jgi:hypothetical protein